MKSYIMALMIAAALLPGTAIAQGPYNGCTGAIDSTGYVLQPMINVLQPLVLVFVDFKDGRLPSGEPPSDTTQLQLVDNLNAVGSLGWNRVSPDSAFYKVIRKYTYEDYWDRTFSDAVWVSNRNPDYTSHNNYVNNSIPTDQRDVYQMTAYGSVRDYWAEVSYGNMEIIGAQTRSGGHPIYDKGVVNNVDTIGGRNFIRWIQLDSVRSYYEGYANGTSRIYSHVRSKLIALHNTPPIPEDSLEFDIVAYEQTSGKIGIIGAGGGDHYTHVFGGFAVLGGRYYADAEKFIWISGAEPGCILDPILTDTHEFGHTIGFYHYQGAGYDAMHWGDLNGGLKHSPPHLNPWSKIMAGWIPEGNIFRVRSDTSVSLPSIAYDPVVAVVTVYGDAGRDDDWDDHSEYFIVEYRNREGFNRFTAGRVVPGDFTGGALIWHYSSLGEFDPLAGQSVERNLGLKIENYPGSFGGADGDPSHLYPYHGSNLDSATTPSSQSVDSLTTGILLNNFALDGGLASFNVAYQLGAPPSYSSVLYPGSATPSSLSGNVYLQRDTWSTLSSIAAGSHIDLAPSTAAPRTFTSYNVQAVGAAPNPIYFDGVGYGSHREKWRYISVTSTYAPRFIQSRISNAEKGVYVQALTGTPSPEVKSCVFSKCDVDIEIIGGIGTNAVDAGMMSGNTLALMIWKRNVKVESGNLTLPSNSVLRLDVYGTTQPFAKVVGRTLQVVGTLDVKSNATIEGDAWRFGNHLTVPNGLTLTINPKSTLQFGNNKRLEVKGSLIAIGTGVDSIRFTRPPDGPAGNWTGIVIENAAVAPTGTIVKARIDQCNTALRVGTNATFNMDSCTISNVGLGVEFVSSGTPGAQTNTIKHSTFSSASNGILTNTISNLAIQNNVINGTSAEELTAGIRCFSSSPTILGNNIQFFGRGVQCANGSSPLLANGLIGGRNVIKNNATGLHCNSSNPNLGWYGVADGQNSIYSSSAYAAQLTNNSIVKAETNWWGTASPDSTTLFSVGSGSSIDFKPYLYSDPNGGGMRMGGDRIVDEIRVRSGRIADPRGERFPLIPADLRNAIIGRAEGRFEEARTLLEVVIESNLVSRESKEWALAELLAVSQNIANEGISSYLISARGTFPSLARTIDFILPHAYLDEGDTFGAVAAFDANIRQYPNSELERDGLYGKFLSALYAEGDTVEASSLLTSLANLFPGSSEEYVANLQYAVYVSSRADSSFSPRGSAGERAEFAKGTPSQGLPTEFRLVQNYPNPFNPRTVIRYDLPDDVTVDLRVYDILGKEVAVLVDEFQKTGYHQVILDGIRLATGVYFYRLTAGPFTDVKKLVVIK